MKKFFKTIGDQIRGFWYGTFYETTSEGHKKWSLGRVLLVVLFIAALKVWLGGAEIPMTMVALLFAMLIYVFGTKMVTAFEKVKSLIK